MRWYEWLLRKKREWEERLLIRQRKVLLQWVEKQGAISDERVLVVSDTSVATFSLDKGVWRHEWGRNKGPFFCRFALCGAGMFPSVKKEHSLSGEWSLIFFAETFEVWESLDFYRERGLALPLRLGLSDQERVWITSEVRRMIGDVLDGKIPVLTSDISGRLSQKQDLDIVLWVGGRLRASVIMLDVTAREALEQGAKRVLHDKRFASLTREELPTARIEISLMSDLFFPVLLRDWSINRIDPTKGYRVTFSEQGKRGWYVPAVHNVITFYSLRNFLFRLATEKAFLTVEESDHARYEQFSVIDWIENNDDIMVLTGPVSRGQREVTKETVVHMTEQVVSWLCQRQESNGHISAIFSTQQGQDRVRLVSLGCVGHVLAVYGQVFSHEQALQAARSIAQYLELCFDNMPFLENLRMNTIAAFSVEVSWLRISCALGIRREQRYFERLRTVLPLFHKEPILWLQTLSLLVDYEAMGDTEYRALLLDELAQVERVFLQGRDNPHMQLALYPEIIAVYHGLWRITKEKQWRDKALEVSSWYEKKQHKNGSFPQTPADHFSYTRGTGKIVEVLACFPEENDRMLRKAFSWLQTMQYTKENTFFMNEAEQQLLVGGFRHDAFNREAWIDASAHVILGATRWLQEKGKDDSL